MTTESQIPNAVAGQAFSFQAPDALNVLLIGDFTHWQKNPIRLHRQPGGVWKTTVSLRPGTYRYRFVVDGNSPDDADCILRVPEE